METTTKALTASELLQGLDVLDGRPLREGEKECDLNSPEEVEFVEVWDRRPTWDVESNDERGTRTMGGELYFKGWRIMGRKHGWGYWRQNIIGFATHSGLFYMSKSCGIGRDPFPKITFPLGEGVYVLTPPIPVKPPRDL